jgi:hypothetical protein
MFQRPFAILGLLWLPICSFGQMTATQTQEIIRRSAQATHADWERASDFDFCERDKTKTGSRTYAVLMIEGSPYNRLVQVNGDDLSSEQEAMEQERLVSTVQRRQHESPGQRAKRVAQYQKERRRDRELLEQLTAAMDFTFAGTELVDSHPVDVFEATPRRGYVPTSMETQVLTAMKGKLWIDQSSFRWVKIQAEVVRPVSIIGFLARVQPGTTFALEESPIVGDMWLPRHFAMQSLAKIAFFFDKSSQADETYFSYKPNGTLSVGSCEGKDAMPGQQQAIGLATKNALLVTLLPVLSATRK